MSNLIKKIKDGEKIVLWIGDNILKLVGLPSKKDLAKTIFSDVNETARVAIENKKSLSEVTQVYLDSVTGSKMNLLKKIKNQFVNNDDWNDPLKLFLEAPFVETIVTTSIDTLIEKHHGNKISKINYYNEEFQGKGEKKLYRVNGSIEEMNKTIITRQDYRKLNTVSLYNDFFERLSEEINDKTVFFIGYDLDDPDTVESISVVLKKLNGMKASAYFITSSSIINSNIVGWLNANDIKIAQETDVQFIQQVKEYMVGEGMIEDESDEVEEKLQKKSQLS